MVDACATGRDAIFHAADGSYDVLVIDRMVLGVDGLAALKALRVTGVDVTRIRTTSRGRIAEVAGIRARPGASAPIFPSLAINGPLFITRCNITNLQDRNNGGRAQSLARL